MVAVRNVRLLGDSTMGTSSEWLRVAAFGAFWGLFFLVWDALTQRDWSSRLNLSGLVLASCSVGMFHVFGWRALHGTLAIIFAVATIGTVATGLAMRRRRKAAETPQIAITPVDRDRPDSQ
jgi:hypothetical protein